MLRQSLRGLTVAAVAAFILGPIAAAAVTPVSGCGALTKAGETYVLTANVSSPTADACFRVLADRITLDLGGFTVTGPGFPNGVGVFDGLGPRIGTVVKNGTLTDFEEGVLLGASTRNTVRNITASGNGIGIAVGYRQPGEGLHRAAQS